MVRHPIVGSKCFDTYFELCEFVIKEARMEAEARLEKDIWMMAYGIAQTIFDTVEELPIEP